MRHKEKGSPCILAACIVIFLNGCTSVNYDGAREMDRDAAISPDYAGVTIPANIAPMNFAILEEGSGFRVRATSPDGTGLRISSADGIVRFPEKSWKNLLSLSQGGKIEIEIFSEGPGGILERYNPFYLDVAAEPIDPYVCYRLLYPGYETWSGIKIIQRDIENFSEVSVVENQMVDNNCVNCHSFSNHDPGRFLLHLRGSMGGTYFVEDGKITRLNLKTESMTSGAVYPAWHPSGNFVAFSSNNVIQTFHAIHDRNIEVLDLASAMVLFDTRSNEMLFPEEDDTTRYMETFPEWSPDGRYLYYCRARQFNEGSDFSEIKYDLVRRPFDEKARAFGGTEMVYNAASMDRSVSFPRISPDGRYLVFTLHNYGTFSIWHREADLYMLDLESGSVKRMSLNSDESESYHSWSSNGRWLVFSSKRADGLTARPYFAYVESPDHIGKPFVMPQKDPTFYDRLLLTYNKPEFITGKIRQGPRDFARAARKKAMKAIEAGSAPGSMDSGSGSN
jgi:WD40 repeat protein